MIFSSIMQFNAASLKNNRTVDGREGNKGKIFDGNRHWPLSRGTERRDHRLYAGPSGPSRLNRVMPSISHCAAHLTPGCRPSHYSAAICHLDDLYKHLYIVFMVKGHHVVSYASSDSQRNIQRRLHFKGVWGFLKNIKLFKHYKKKQPLCENKHKYVVTVDKTNELLS